MTDDTTTAEIAHLAPLAEFRFQLRKFLSFSEASAERWGIAAQQYQLMQVIGAMPPGQFASISHLADRMVLRHNSAVELVDRAERAGLVRRQSDESDLRRSLVVLTQEGLRILTGMVSEHIVELNKRSSEIVRALDGVVGSDVTRPATSTTTL